MGDTIIPDNNNVSSRRFQNSSSWVMGCSSRVVAMTVRSKAGLRGFIGVKGSVPVTTYHHIPSSSFFPLISLFFMPQDPVSANPNNTHIDEDAPGPPISVPDSGDTGEGGKIKMIVQLVKKCLGVKDIAAMFVFVSFLHIS